MPRSIEVSLKPHEGVHRQAEISVYAYAPAPTVHPSLSQAVYLDVKCAGAQLWQELTPAEARILADDLIAVASVVDEQIAAAKGRRTSLVDDPRPAPAGQTA